MYNLYFDRLRSFMLGKKVIHKKIIDPSCKIERPRNKNRFVTKRGNMNFQDQASMGSFDDSISVKPATKHRASRRGCKYYLSISYDHIAFRLSPSNMGSVAQLPAGGAPAGASPSKFGKQLGGNSSFFLGTDTANGGASGKKSPGLSTF